MTEEAQKTEITKTKHGIHARKLGHHANKSQHYEIDMAHGPLVGKLLLFAIPLIFSSVLQLLFNAADIVVVGRFAGPESIAAVGSTGSISNLIVSLFMGLSVGVNVLCARHYAAGQQRDMDETVHTAVAVSLLGGVILAVVGVAIAPTVLRWMSSPPDVIDLAALYMRIYFAGMPMSLLYNFGSAILRAVGDTRRPLYYLFAAGVINVVLNLIFVIVFHMGVAGVALATIISQAVSAILVVISLMRSEESYHLDLKRVRIVPEKMAQIAQIGLPAGLQGTVFSISNTLIQSTINSFGSVVMAGNAAAANIEGFVYVSMNAMYQASISFTGQCYGVHDFKRIRKVLFSCLGIVVVVGLVLGNAAYFFGRPLLSIYTSDPETISYGLRRMALVCSPYFLCGMMDTVCGSIRGLGSGLPPMVVSLLGACAFRIVWIYTVFQMWPTLEVLYVSYPISWALTMAAHLVCFFILLHRAERRENAQLSQ